MAAPLHRAGPALSALRARAELRAARAPRQPARPQAPPPPPQQRCRHLMSGPRAGRPPPRRRQPGSPCGREPAPRCRRGGTGLRGPGSRGAVRRRSARRPRPSSARSRQQHPLAARRRRGGRQCLRPGRRRSVGELLQLALNPHPGPKPHLRGGSGAGPACRTVRGLTCAPLTVARSRLWPGQGGPRGSSPVRVLLENALRKGFSFPSVSRDLNPYEPRCLRGEAEGYCPIACINSLTFMQDAGFGLQYLILPNLMRACARRGVSVAMGFVLLLSTCIKLGFTRGGHNTACLSQIYVAASAFLSFYSRSLVLIKEQLSKHSP